MSSPHSDKDDDNNKDHDTFLRRDDNLAAPVGTGDDDFMGTNPDDGQQPPSLSANPGARFSSSNYPDLPMQQPFAVQPTFQSASMLHMPDPGQVQQAASPTSGFGAAQFRGMATMSMAPQLQFAPTEFSQSKSAPDLSSGPTFSQIKEIQIIEPLPPKVIGWDLNKAELPALPQYFPKDMIKLELPMQEFGKVLTNFEACFRSLSIQAEYCSNPVSAKLQTLEYIDLHVLLWKAPTEDAFYIDIQRRKGDFLDANRYVHKLLDAARGQPVQDTFSANQPLNAENMLGIESLINKVMPSNPAPAPSSWMGAQSAEQTTSHALNTVYSSLTSKRLDMRKMGLEFLSSYTDLQHTLSSTAIPSALVVLAGKSPTPQDEEKCKEIQRILIWIIQNREFEGDEELFPSTTDGMQVDGEQFLRSDEEEGNGRPAHYVEYMSEVYHLALTILVNSLEVVACFRQRLDVEQEVKAFLDAYENVSGPDRMYTTLKDCVRRAERKLSNGYLACKALRLLAESQPALRKQMGSDSEVGKNIQEALRIGNERHALLATESKNLHNCLYSP